MTATATPRYYYTTTARRERAAAAAAETAAARPVSSTFKINRKVTGMETRIPGVTDTVRGTAAGIRFRIIDTKLGKIVVHRPAEGPEDMDWGYAPAAFATVGEALRYLDEVAISAR